MSIILNKSKHQGAIAPNMSNSIDSPNFHEWVRNQLVEYGWSMRELARQANVSHSLVAKVMSGQKPSWEFCAAIADPFEVSPIEVLLRAGKLTFKDIQQVLPMLPKKPAGTAEQLALAVSKLSAEQQEALLLSTSDLMSHNETVAQLSR